MDFLKEYFSLFVTVGGWCMTIGLYIAKIKQHDIEIKDLKEKQDSVDRLLSSIDKQLTELNTKVSLLLQGKIQIDKD